MARVTQCCTSDHQTGTSAGGFVDTLGSAGKKAWEDAALAGFLAKIRYVDGGGVEREATLLKKNDASLETKFINIEE